MFVTLLYSLMICIDSTFRRCESCIDMSRDVKQLSTFPPNASLKDLHQRKQAFAGNIFYRLLSLPLTSVLMNSYVNALVFVRRIARRGKFLHNPRHMSPTSSSCCVCELHINHGCAFTVHFLLTDGGRRR